MTNQEKIDSIIHFKGARHKSYGSIWKIIEAPEDKSVFAKYMETRHKQGEKFAKLSYSNYPMAVYVVFMYQQIMSPFKFEDFNEKIAVDVIVNNQQ